MSIEILVIVVLGGMGSVPGSILAAVVLQALPEAMREFADYRMLIYAVVLILVMLVTNNPKLRALAESLHPARIAERRREKKSSGREAA